MMRRVIGAGTGSCAAVPGYTVAGKTGTAQIWDPKARNGLGDWDPVRYTFSFVGFIGRQPAVADLVIAVRIEDARPIVAKAGALVARVVDMKRFPGAREFAVLDAGMGELVRPAMYGSRHEILPVVEPPVSPGAQPVDVVGPVCETSDRFAQDYHLPPLKAGDLIAFMTAGAYGAVMSSTYNSRPLIPEVLVQGARYAVVRRRPSIAEMLALEQMPPWLANGTEASRTG